MDAADITLEDFDNLLEERKRTLAAMKGEHSECIEGCKDKYTDDNGDKIAGRAACKANCWVDTAVEVLKAAAEIAGALS